MLTPLSKGMPRGSYSLRTETRKATWGVWGGQWQRWGTYPHFFLEIDGIGRMLCSEMLPVCRLPVLQFSPVANGLDKLLQAQQGNEIQAQISLFLGI